jgi:hypothetical protein
VANDKRRRGGGRVTPKSGANSGAKGSPADRSPAGRPRLPARIGPFSRPDPDAAPGQVGRRPSSPAKLVLFALVYFACGIIAFLVLTGSWRVILGVVFIGVGLLWLRGAATAALRQQRRRDGS